MYMVEDYFSLLEAKCLYINKLWYEEMQSSCLSGLQLGSATKVERNEKQISQG